MLTVSIITVSITTLIALAILFRNYKSLPYVVFSISLISTVSALLSDTMSILRPESIGEWKLAAFISEAIMVSSWLLFSASFARADKWKTFNVFTKLLICSSPLFILFFTAIPVEDIFYSPEFGVEKILFLENPGFAFHLFLLLYSIMAIVNLEGTLKGSSGITRWNIKYTLIGVGGILAVNIFYYSQALLFRSLNMNFLPVRTGVILISILVIGFSFLRHKVSDVEVAVSRKIIYRSISLFLVGSYLLGLGIIGEGMRYFGPDVGKNITAFLGFVGAIIVLTVILSERLRRKVMVFVNRNFYSQKYDYREQWLRFTERISLKHSVEELMSSIAEGFMDAIGSRGIGIWLKEKEYGVYSCVKELHLPVEDVHPNEALIDFLTDRKWIINVHDLNCREVVAGNAEFIEKTKASLIVPLLDRDDLTGFIVLTEGLAGDDYNYEDFDLLITLARQATVVILNARLSEDLMDAKEMEAVGRLASFIMHDLKNSASMLSLVTQNAEMHIDKPEFQRDAFKTIANTSEKIKGIIEKLKDLPHKMELKMQYNDLGQYVKSAVAEINLNGKSNISFQELNQVKTKFNSDEITKVIINLILNALEAIELQGQIKIVVGSDSGMGYVRVSDDGCGMSREFIEKNLFRPFQTTKDNGLGIGLYQCKTIIAAHAGVFEVDSKEGRGTDFTFYLPLLSD